MLVTQHRFTNIFTDEKRKQYMKPTMTILSMRISKIIGLAALLTLTAFAGPITITYSSIGTGSVGATSFTNAPFTITELLDTVNRQAVQNLIFLNDNSALIAI